jgi:predicted transcriptional regulator
MEYFGSLFNVGFEKFGIKLSFLDRAGQSGV